MADTPAEPKSTVLVVDDYKDAADALAFLLETCGFVAAVAYDGAQAIQMANVLHPNVIFLEIGLPKRNGLEVCRRIRQEPWGAHTRIVAITGLPIRPMRQAMQDAGFDHVFAKPCSFREISEVLDYQQD